MRLSNSADAVTPCASLPCTSVVPARGEKKTMKTVWPEPSNTLLGFGHTPLCIGSALLVAGGGYGHRVLACHDVGFCRGSCFRSRLASTAQQAVTTPPAVMWQRRGQTGTADVQCAAAGRRRDGAETLVVGANTCSRRFTSVPPAVSIKICRQSTSEGRILTSQKGDIDDGHH